MLVGPIQQACHPAVNKGGLLAQVCKQPLQAAIVALPYGAKIAAQILLATAAIAIDRHLVVGSKEYAFCILPAPNSLVSLLGQTVGKR